jgi:steroid delta-isomerase-like uncharacterized protein
MSSEGDEAIVRRLFEEAWSKGNLAVIDEVIAPNYVNHSPLVPGLPPGSEGVKLSTQGLRNAFPDIHYTIEDMIAEGDKVVTRWIARGTHKGEFLGIPATGKEGEATGISIMRVVGAKIVESWSNIDLLGLMQRLGVLPSPGQGGV